MKFLGAALALSGFAAAATGPIARAPEAKVSYDNYHIYRIRAETPRDIEDIEGRLASFHSVHSADALEVAIPPNEVRSFEDMGFDFTLLTRDMGKQIRDEAEHPVTYKRSLDKRGELPDLSWFDSYHSYNDHLQYWDDLVEAFPENSEKITLGPSYEGRDIHAFHLWGGEGKKGDKPVIVVEYLAYQLIDGYKAGDKNVTSFFDEYDFWLVPFHNPDGFVYTQTNNRMWRKNRQPRRNTTCIGTDNNRNWNYQWYFEPEEGSVSPDPCAESFKGRCPGDTPENVAVSALSQKLAEGPHGIRSFIDWHSYSQLILTPWGWSCDPADLPKTLPRMREVGQGTAAAIKAVSGRNYTVGPACEVLYFSTGTGRDFHHGAAGASHSWTLELPPANARDGGFILPPAQIWPTVKEQWAGQLYLLNEVRKD
ncbi:hypothetical protein ACHAQA_003595 [Verticillium albo-atrum]